MTTLQATPIPDVVLPFHVGADPDGESWAMFHYDAWPADPWHWPKALSIDGHTYIYRGHNSDSRTVHYSRMRPTEVMAHVQGGAA